jgi:hypothetical protein
LLGLIKLYKLLKGKKPEPPSITIIDNSTTIINDVKVDARTAQLYLSDPIRNEVDKALRPIAKPGIDKLEVRKDKAVLEEINKGDLPERVFEHYRYNFIRQRAGAFEH